MAGPCCSLVALGYALASVVSAFWAAVCQFFSGFVCSPKPLRDYGKWAVVTGSTDGIGKEMADQLAKSGLSVLIIGRNSEKVNGTVKELSNSCRAGEEIRSLVVDFANPDYEKIGETLSKLDIGILINNVGMSYPSAQYFSEISADFVDKLLEVNIRSAMRMTHLVYGDMVERGRGAIVCVGSGASQLPSEPLYAAYAGAKGGIEAFCRSLQVEAASKGILVQCHTPLLVTSKLSKIRNPSLTVPSAKYYAKNAISTIQRGCKKGNPTKSPYFGHTLMMAGISLLPRMFWNWLRFGQTKQIRARYMKKLEGKTT